MDKLLIAPPQKIIFDINRSSLADVITRTDDARTDFRFGSKGVVRRPCSNYRFGRIAVVGENTDYDQTLIGADPVRRRMIFRPW